MAKRKIVYQNWIVDIGYDPKQSPINITDIRPNEKIISAVQKAIKKLSNQERTFIEKYYFDGQSCLQIAKEMNRKIRSVEGLHHRAINRLKKFLADFVKEQYGIKVEIGRECPLCQSPHKDEIGEIINDKKKNETWKNIIRIIKSKYKIPVKTPQLLIGHQKYHMK